MARIGIDLGTTNSVVSEYKNGRKIIIPINGQLTTPSVVYIDEAGKIIVGHEAKQMIPIHSERILQSTKRYMGTDETYIIGGETYTPVDAATHVLSYLKREIEKYINDEIREVVITVPAYFKPRAIEDTQKAARNAGFEPLNLIAEPTSAAVAYGFDKNINQSLLIVDLGGGTFDVTVLEITTDPATNGTIYQAVAVDGNDQLGGDDFDNALVELFIQNGAPKNEARKLKEEAEKVKIQLSSMNKVEVHIASCDFSTVITRDEYRKLIQKYLDEIIIKIKETVKQSGKTIDDINRVVLVGGSCKHPVVQEAIKKLTQRDPYIAGNMDTVVAEGAALTHHIEKTPGDDTIINVIPISLGTDVNFDGKLLNIKLIQKGESIPQEGLRRAHFALALEGQKQLISRVIQGEGQLVEDKQNLELGAINMELRHTEYGHPIVTVFVIDAKTRRLSFITYEVPLTEKNKEEIIKLNENQTNKKTGLINWEAWKTFEQKHKNTCTIEELELKDILKE